MDARYLLVRPEEIVTIADGAEPPANSITLEIGTIIQYGNESVLIGSIPGTNVSLRVRVSARAGRDLPDSGSIRVGWPAASGYVV